MRWTSILAIYFLFWVLSAFLVMPFGNRTHLDEESEGKDSGMVPGQSASAPINFQPKRIAIRATILSAALFGLFLANYVEGWVTTADIDFSGGAPNLHGEKD
jgi:predicted secreted protein